MTVISSTAIVDLIARLEKATGPDREIDCAIGVAVGLFQARPPRFDGDDIHYAKIENDGSFLLPGQAGDMFVPRYTASIDAALTLVPQQEFLVWSLWCAIGSYSCNIHISGGGWSDDRTLGTSAGAKTPAIALCIAALRARAAVEERK